MGFSLCSTLSTTVLKFIGKVYCSFRVLLGMLDVKENLVAMI